MLATCLKEALQDHKIVAGVVIETHPPTGPHARLRSKMKNNVYICKKLAKISVEQVRLNENTLVILPKLG